MLVLSVCRLSGSVVCDTCCQLPQRGWMHALVADSRLRWHPGHPGLCRSQPVLAGGWGSSLSLPSLYVLSCMPASGMRPAAFVVATIALSCSTADGCPLQMVQVLSTHRACCTERGCTHPDAVLGSQLVIGDRRGWGLMTLDRLRGIVVCRRLQRLHHDPALLNQGQYVTNIRQLYTFF